MDLVCVGSTRVSHEKQVYPRVDLGRPGSIRIDLSRSASEPASTRIDQSLLMSRGGWESDGLEIEIRLMQLIALNTLVFFRRNHVQRDVET